VTGSGLDGRPSGDDAAEKKQQQKRNFHRTGIQILARNLQGDQIECDPKRERLDLTRWGAAAAVRGHGLVARRIARDGTGSERGGGGGIWEVGDREGESKMAGGGGGGGGKRRMAGKASHFPPSDAGWA